MSKASLGAVAVLTAATLSPVAVVGISNVVDSQQLSTSATPGETGTQEVALSDAPNAMGIPQDIAGGEGPVKEITSETPFSMIGITWDGERDASAKIRAKQADGSWGEWFEADSMIDDVDGPSANGRSGTEPVYLGTETTAVQVALRGIDIAETSLDGAPEATSEAEQGETAQSEDVHGETAQTGQDTQAGQTPSHEGAPAASDASQPDSARQDSHAVNTGEAVAGALAGLGGAEQAGFSDVNKPVVEDYGQIGPVADTQTTGVQAVLLSPDLNTPAATDGGETGEYGDIATPKKPNIVSRAGWGANEGMRCQQPYYDDRVIAATVHHTAGSNNYTKDQSAGVVRGIYTYHAKNLGWCDIGYNVLVDKYGQAFEGRFGGLDKAVQGAHAGGFNGNTFGISMMGDYSTVQPPREMIQKVGEVIGWKLAISKVEPKGTTTHYSEGTSYAKYPAGTAVKLPNIFAHRDVGNTACPGDAGYAQMGTIRDIAARYAKGSGGSGGSTPTPNPSPTKPSESSPVTTTPRPSDGGGNGGNGGNGGAGDIDTGSLEQALGSSTGNASVDKLLAGLDKGALAKQISALLMGGKNLDLSGLQALGAVDDLSSILVTAQALLDGGNGGELSQLWTALGGAGGPLGKALSGVQKYKDVSYAKFENGAIYQSAATGTHPVWGAIGDAWAAQGFEHGQLGLPISGETTRGDGTIAQQFQHGTMVFDPATGTVHVEK